VKFDLWMIKKVFCRLSMGSAGATEATGFSIPGQFTRFSFLPLGTPK